MGTFLNKVLAMVDLFYFLLYLRTFLRAKCFSNEVARRFVAV